MNRYVNLLMFGQVFDAPACQAVFANLDPQGFDELRKLWEASPHRRHVEAGQPDPAMRQTSGQQSERPTATVGE